MSAARTQVYLTEAQRRRIDAITKREGVTLAEVVRRALDAYLPTSDIDATTALRSSFGADPTVNVPDRAEWDRG